MKRTFALLTLGLTVTLTLTLTIRSVAPLPSGERQSRSGVASPTRGSEESEREPAHFTTTPALPPTANRQDEIASASVIEQEEEESEEARAKEKAEEKQERPGKTYLGWPGARVLAVQESPAIDGLSTRVTLLQPTNFPHAVYVEEKRNGLDAPDEERVVRRFEAVASHLLVKMRETFAAENTARDENSERLAAIVRQFGGTVRRHPTAENLYYVDLPELQPDGVRQAQAVLSQYPEWIEYAEPDAIVRAAATTPNDPRFAAEQWGLNNVGQEAGTIDVDLDGPEAWDLRREATNVIVAVVDSGIRYTHEDLAANMWRNPGEVPGNNIDDDGNGFVDDVYGINAIDDSSNPTDDLPDVTLGVGGHGTSVAGVIGAVGNNGKGIAGVAWKVQLMALKWFNNQGAGALSDAVQCLDYARAKGAAIVNASWQQGGLLSGTVNQSMIDAIQRLRGAGILFVSSAGNDGANNDLVAHFPSNYPFDNMVAVAAGTRTGVLSRKSNFGERLVDVVAPGENVLSTTSKADDDYSLVTGTSFAAPHVSGVLALLKAQFPTADYRALINRLLAGADRKERLVGKVRTGAFVNLFNALRATAVSEFPEITTLVLNGEAVGSQQEVSIIQGTNVVLALTAVGTAPLFYSWQRDGKIMSGATGTNLVIPAFAASDIGEYQVAVSNVAGVATLGLKLLGVVAKPEVAAAVNATNRTFLSSGNTLWESQNTVTRDGLTAGASGKIAARQGTLASTTVSGPGKASFVWKVSSERNNDTLDCLIDGVKVDSISGEVDWTKKEFQISPGPHELRWRYVKDASLSKGDDKGYLDLFEFVSEAKVAPTITTQPKSQTVLEGGPVLFAVVATGSDPLAYQWQKDGTNIVSARSNRLDLVNVTTAADGFYSVIVSNEAGTVTSASARLTVALAASPPRVTTQPADIAADAGGAASLTVVSSGTPPLHYQWRKAGAALPAQTNATLTLSNLVLADAGLYSVVVSNRAGLDLSREARLSVAQLQLAPVISKQPGSQAIAAGTRLELVVETGGLGPFTYQWTRNGQALAGQTQPELTRTNAQPADAGDYQVRISSPFGVTLSAVAQIRVTVSTPPLAQATDNPGFTWNTAGDAPWFRQTAQTFDGVDALQSGALTNLQFSEVTATVVGPGQVSFWWKVSSEFGYDFLDLYVDNEFADGISGEWGWEEILYNLPAGTHTLTWVYSKDEDVSDGADAAWLDNVSFVSFNTELPVIVRHPVQQSGLEGESVTFEVEAAGSPPFTYRWFKDNVALPNATNAALTVPNLSSASEGFYHVAVSNRFGGALSRVAALSVFDEADAIDVALNSPGLSWTNSGYASWFPQTETSIDGVSAMQSGPVADNGVAWLGTAIEGPGVLYFSWKVSSETDYDVLELLVDGEIYDYISGETDWADMSILVPPGLHYFDWVYLKDEVESAGEDAGWLDFVAFEASNGFAVWQNSYFTPADLLDPEISGLEADADFDGIVNILEYSFGLNPVVPDINAVGLPAVSMESGPQGKVLTLTYRRRTNDADLSYRVETSTNLVTWTGSLPAAWTETVTSLEPGLELVRARRTSPLPANSSAFYRVRVTFDAP